jgi:hypothetical protein
MQERIGLSLLVLVGLVTVGCARAGDAQHHPQTALETRVMLYSKALALNVDQQQQLRGLLIQQGAQLRRVWSDTSVPSETRIQASRAVTQVTADRIRSILTDEQRKKYNAPHVRAPASVTRGRSVEEWMNAVAAH